MALLVLSHSTSEKTVRRKLRALQERSFTYTKPHQENTFRRVTKFNISTQMIYLRFRLTTHGGGAGMDGSAETNKPIRKKSGTRTGSRASAFQRTLSPWCRHGVSSIPFEKVSFADTAGNPSRSDYCCAYFSSGIFHIFSANLFTQVQVFSLARRAARSILQKAHPSAKLRCASTAASAAVEYVGGRTQPRRTERRELAARCRVPYRTELDSAHASFARHHHHRNRNPVRRGVWYDEAEVHVCGLYCVVS